MSIIETPHGASTPNQDDTSGQSSSNENQAAEPTQPLIRGVTSNSPATSPVRIHHCIDWLAYTVPYEIGYEAAFFPHEALALTGEVLPHNIQGYDTRLALTQGSVSLHSRYPQHKICVQFTGTDLYWLGKGGVNPLALLHYVPAVGGHMTRLDFAVDYFGPSFPLELREAWEAGSLKTPAHACETRSKAKRNKRQEPANSTYIGSHTSERMLRCYDKAAQMNAQGPWTRIELVSKKGYSNRLGEAMIAQGIGAAGKQAIRNFIHCEVEWFNRAVTGPSVYIAAEPAQQHDTKRWLLEDVLPIFVKEVQKEAEEGDSELRDTYLRALYELGDQY